MSFQKIVSIVLVLVVVLQFYLSFIKGRNIKEDIGEILYTLKVSSLKMKFIGFLILLIILYLMSLVIKNNATFLSVLIIVYLLLCIYDFSKIKIITKNGIAMKSIYTKNTYNFINWTDISNWYWHEKRDTMLVYEYRQNGKTITADWEVGKSERDKIQELFKAFIVKEIDTIE